MILETIIGVSAIYLFAKAQKPKSKSIVPSKVSLDAIEVMPLDQTINNSQNLIVPKEEKKPTESIVPTIGKKNEGAYIQFFTTPAAKEFYQKMQTIGFNDSRESALYKWPKFFFWLRFNEMPDVNNKITGVSSSEQVRLLMNEARSRNLFNDDSFERLAKYMAPVKGSTTIINQSAAQALAEYKRKAIEQANRQIMQTQGKEALRLREREKILADKKLQNIANLLNSNTNKAEIYRTGPWTSVRDLINQERRSALTPSAFARVTKESPIVGGDTQNLPNAIVMPEGFVFLPQGKRFAYFTSPDATIFYETVVYVIPGRSIDPIIAGRVVSKAEYMAAKNLNK